MTQPDELKPCPLPACGGIAKRHRVSNPVLDNYYDHSIKCSKCGLQTAYVPIRVDNPVPPQMYDRWNHRTPDQQAIDDVKLLRETLHDLYTEHPSPTWSEDVLVLKALAATDRPEYKETKTND